MFLLGPRFLNDNTGEKQKNQKKAKNGKFDLSQKMHLWYGVLP